MTLTGQVRLWNLSDPHHPAISTSLGTADFPTLAGFYVGPGVTSDAAGDLVAVVGSGALHLWRITDAIDAVAAGSLPVPAAANNFAGVLGNHTAMVATTAGFDWWDVSNPDHPVRAGSSSVAAASTDTKAKQDGVVMNSATTGGAVLAADTTNQVSCQCRWLLFRFGANAGPTARVTLPGAVGSVLSPSNDNRLLASDSSNANVVTLWDISDPQHPQPRSSILALEGIRGITFDPADRVMAVWNNDTVQLWDIHNRTSPNLEASYKPADGSIATAAFSLTQPTLLLATNGTVSMLDMDPAKLADHLCQYTGGAPLTASQWQRYAPGIAPQDPCLRH
ncbi:hypothetical protein [Kitasatospora sp. LaBMicrA B282]|uniref:hypothetical protein n=1 Tax=Kitasatospora sp. LaBMicrA B282 TaxID=3420949 RepID=UPI003D10C1A4